MKDAEAELIVSQVVAKLKARRESLGWSLNRLAQATHLDIRGISRIEKGERSPGLNTLLRLSSALRLPLHQVLQDLEQFTPPPAADQ